MTSVRIPYTGWGFLLSIWSNTMAKRVTLTLYASKAGNLKRVTIEGHTDKRSDTGRAVCNGVSTLAVTLAYRMGLNPLDHVTPGQSDIPISNTRVAKTSAAFAVTGWRMLAKANPQHLKIYDVVV
jgi:uncharacterized protein YsxB (DUF464 family)